MASSRCESDRLTRTVQLVVEAIEARPLFLPASQMLGTVFQAGPWAVVKG